MERQRVFSGAPWEKEVGYCRALRVGEQIVVGGTAPVGDSGETVAPGDAYLQTKKCLEIIARALAGVGASMQDVVRTRLFVTDVSRWADYGRAHSEAFRGTPPVTSMVEVRALIDPAMMVEIEADAVATRAAR